jgi:hypothetical protein
LRQPCTNVSDRERRYTTLYGSRIAPYTECRCLPFNHLAFLCDLRIQNPFPTVSLRVHASYTEAAHDLCISPFFFVNGRLRSCMFGLGLHSLHMVFSFPSYSVRLWCWHMVFPIWRENTSCHHLCSYINIRIFSTIKCSFSITENAPAL